MAIRSVKLHGLDWELNTDDWDNPDDGEIAEEFMLDGIRKLTDPAATHAALLRFQEAENPAIDKPQAVADIESLALRMGCVGYARIPDSGHNSAIRAIGTV